MKFVAVFCLGAPQQRCCMAKLKTVTLCVVAAYVSMCWLSNLQFQWLALQPVLCVGGGVLGRWVARGSGRGFMWSACCVRFGQPQQQKVCGICLMHVFGIC